jgi:hypothetical protein
VHQEIGGFDHTIDDDCHLNKHIITLLEILFQKLKTGGIYAVENIRPSH